MDWHDTSCRKLDLFECDGLRSCMGCGSTDTKLSPAPSPITPIPALPPIRRDRKEVRLLRLPAGSFADEIRCHVVVGDLSFNTEYIALSYTWADDNGDDTKHGSILVDGRPFPVTKNCEFALRRARSEIHTIVIWVDAICIDQDNDEERGHQVKLMPQIYSRAQSVLIYVGESTKRNVCDIESLKAFDIRVTLEQLFSRRYFSRVWILQEIALAKTALLVSGNDSIPWARVVEAAGRVIELDERPPVLDLNRQVCLLPRQELRLLDLGRQSQATNPRDKVFALLGLLPNRCIGQVEADYTLTVEELYTKVALELASSYDWSDVLVRAGACQRTISALPSWAPDWSFNRLPDPIRWKSNEPNAAAQLRGPWARLGNKGRSLNVRVFRGKNSRMMSPDIGYHETLRWYAPLSCKSRSSTYLWIDKSDIIAKTTMGGLWSLNMDLPQSPIHVYFDQSCVMLDLVPDFDGTWTLWQASLEPQTHYCIPIEDALDLSTLNLTRSEQLKPATFLSPQILSPSFAEAPEEDMWMMRFYGPTDRRGLNLSSTFTGHASVIEANDRFWRYLVRKYLVREEWVKIY
ncbi:hypothetical protein PFICI_11296 [Pestalotiopsis fici W106-1]|uniref:Heterokaryon incompatibility domain-containing protein n=1 Tax=Pestalotiopsis fici (strain W106-1 / CGMCC3.15140) TaxID=1229662 RepID=W3WWC8_PESFW|nr:uncharacterized protein PFICI_11296 [Pestalotiopsis fici W106-1]ETS77422.1 hypothetical protein PFICI_11296 [Pestalotiopsis fici W106-1]